MKKNRLWEALQIWCELPILEGVDLIVTRTHHGLGREVSPVPLKYREQDAKLVRANDHSGVVVGRPVPGWTSNPITEIRRNPDGSYTVTTTSRAIYSITIATP